MFSNSLPQLQVSVEYGLYEMMSWRAIRLEVAPKNENWGFNISEREAMLSAGTVDKNVERVYKEEKKRMDVNCLQNHSIQSAYHVAQRFLCLKYSNQVGNTIRPALMNLKECCCLKFISLKFIVVVFERTDTKDYVPELAELIIDRNNNPSLHIDLKGILLGNPETYAED
ncbi:putative alpha/Beta hydrolase [Medicago truncatula]|uniref:Putative alpha/Beta hydrolase n=1 Tax=Medicago truncatula TaxID=3880 RepID=A0A396HPA8_MEDTR|nr:putative alpha/Beta hydrolase [Medicago truncatula]